MNSQRSSPIRISCPQCRGKVKVPPHEAGQRYQCPRCGADIVAPGESPAEATEVRDEQAIASTPPADANVLRLARPGPPSEDDCFGISCQICGTRLHVRTIQVGTTIECPDCYSPVTVPAPPKRSQPWQMAKQAWVDPGTSVDAPTDMRVATQARLKQAGAELEQEEADEREASAERFTEALLSFFADSHALARLATLAIWFELTMMLFRYATGIRSSENAPAMLDQAASLVATLALAAMSLTFLFAVAACGLALIKDTSAGLRKIEHWPEIDFVCWRSDVFYVVNSGLLAALPGAALGIVLGFAGVSGLVLYTTAASFGALFPPMLLSMFQMESARSPFSQAAWDSIRERPDPWSLTYLITAVVIIAGLVAYVFCLVSGFLLGAVSGVLVGLFLATAMVALIMIYFRTIGRLFCVLAGHDVIRAADPQRPSPES